MFVMLNILSQRLNMVTQQFLWVSMRVCSLHLIWKMTSPCLLLTMLLADNFRMQNY